MDLFEVKAKIQVLRNSWISSAGEYKKDPVQRRIHCYALRTLCLIQADRISTRSIPRRFPPAFYDQAIDAWSRRASELSDSAA